MIKVFAVMYVLCFLPAFSSVTHEISLVHKDAIKSAVQVMEYAMDSAEAASHVEDITQANYQEALKKLGYYKAEGNDERLNTRNAVIRFQSDHNLAVSGLWDEKSMAALKKKLKDICFTYPDTVSSPPVTTKWITINKTKRILTLYQNASVLKKYPVALGNPLSLTPSGKFSIVNKVVNPAWGGGGYAQPVAGGSPRNPLGYRWMGLSPKGGNSYGIHGNNSPYSIGTYASHGCIRMINSDVESLFEIVPVNIPVWIGTEEELAAWGVVQKEYLYP